METNLNDTFSLFLPGTKATLKRTCVVDTNDYELVQQCFPERGVLAYLPGLLFKIIADELRKEGIHNYVDRIQNHPRWATLSGLVSDLRAVGNANDGDESRGTARVPEQHKATGGGAPVAKSGAKPKATRKKKSQAKS